jgi:hypothetical protein
MLPMPEVFHSGSVTATNFNGNGAGLTNLNATNLIGILTNNTTGHATTATTAGTATNVVSGIVITNGTYSGNGGGLTNLQTTNLIGTPFYLQNAVQQEMSYSGGQQGPIDGAYIIPSTGVGNDYLILSLPPITWWGWAGKTNFVLTSDFVCTNKDIADFILVWYVISTNGVPSTLDNSVNRWITNLVAGTNVMSLVATQAIPNYAASIAVDIYYFPNSGTNTIWWRGGTVIAIP